MKTYLMVLATVVALSISYYFVVALPANNRSHLDFEKEKYRNEQAEMKAKNLAQAEEVRTRQSMLSGCLVEAGKNYDNLIARNGTKSAMGGYSVDTRILAILGKQRAEAVAECHKQFGP